MIQSFQKFSQSRVAKIFLAIVALSFMAFFGGGSLFHPYDPHAVVAEVGNVSLPTHEFATAVQKQTQSMMSQSGESLAREDLLKMGIPQMILSQLIQENLLNLEVTHLGLTVNDETLKNYIHSVKAFQNDKGIFDRALFIQVLRTHGLSEDGFIAQVRGELIRNQLMDAIMAGVHVPDDMIQRLFDVQYQHRQASMLMVSPQTMPTPPSPDKNILETFYKDHQKMFETPELRTLITFMIDPSVFAKEMPVTEEEIKSVYEAKIETFNQKPLKDVRDLVVLDIQKEKANERAYQLSQDLDDKIAGGATFEELLPLTKEASLIKLVLVDAKGKDRLNTLSPDLPKDKDFSQEILQTGFSLEENTDSPFTQAKNGTYYTVRADKITPAVLQPFKEIEARVLKAWITADQLKMAEKKAEEHVKSFNEGNKLVSLMTLLPNLSLSESSSSVNNDVKNLVFSLRPHQAGMALTPEGFAVVVLNKVIPPEAKVKEEKMSSFKEELLKQYQQDVLMAYLNALRLRYPVKVNGGVIKALYGPQNS